MSKNARTGLLVGLVVLAAAAVGVLLLGDGARDDGRGDDVRRDAGSGGPLDPVGVGAEPEAPASSGGVALAALHGEGDLGAVRLRLVRADRAPVAGQEVRLVTRAGAETRLASAADGVVLFARLAPVRGSRIEVEGEGFSPVTVQGVSVRPGETTDLGDLVLSANHVVQGRVVDAEGRAVPGAAVAAFETNRRMALEGVVQFLYQQAMATPEPVDRATSDEDGRFALARLPAGAFHLVARKAGFATKFQPDVVVGKDRAARVLTIVLSDGARAHGRVTDADGKSVPSADVVALRDLGNRFEPNGVVEREATRTDGEGRYALDTLARGAGYRFGVTAPGHAILFEPTPVVVDLELEKDFVLPPAGAIEGRVTDKASGGPIEGARVLVVAGRLPMGGGMGRGGGGGGGDAPVTPGEGRTDAEGRFRIERLEAGPVSLAQVKAAGYATLTVNSFLGGSWGDVEPGETLEVEVSLERGGAVVGVVQDASSAKGIPAATVSVVPRANAWSVFLAGAPSAETDAEGKFRIDGVLPGAYSLVTAAAGYASPSPTDEANVVTVPPEGGETTASLQLVTAGAVSGVVKDAQGEPVGGARVRARQTGGRGRGGGMSWRSFLPGAVSSDLTDQDGRFRIEGVASGEKWIVTAESEEHVPSESEPFEVAPGETKKVDVVVRGGGAIRGRVVDDRGRFVEGARVRVGRLSPEDAARRDLSAWQVDRYLGAAVLVTDAEGRFHATRVPPGRALVKVEKEGFVTWYRRDLEVRPDETVENYVASLVPGQAVAGFVRDEAGRPVPGALVAVSGQANPGGGTDDASAGANDSVEPQMLDRTDAQGRFEVRNVPPGRTWTVLVWAAPGHASWSQGRSDAAIRRGVQVPADDVEFRLPAAETTGRPGPPQGPPRPR